MRIGDSAHILTFLNCFLVETIVEKSEFFKMRLFLVLFGWRSCSPRRCQRQNVSHQQTSSEWVTELSVHIFLYIVKLKILSPSDWFSNTRIANGWTLIWSYVFYHQGISSWWTAPLSNCKTEKYNRGWIIFYKICCLFSLLSFIRILQSREVYLIFTVPVYFGKTILILKRVLVF